MSSLRSLKRNVVKNQYNVSKEDDSGGKKNVDKKPRYFNDNKATTKYLKTMKASDNTKNNSQNKTSTGAKTKVC